MPRGTANQDGRNADTTDVKPWQGKAPLRHLVMAALITVAATAAPLTSARAAESTWPTAQATAANAEWVPYLDPPPKPAAICMVDSGVNITPDTPADSPDGPIVKRLSLDGGTGEAAGTTWEALHGTRMALTAVAPHNGWGTVGVWPGARLVSVRALPTNGAMFPFEDYQRAIDLCVKEVVVNNVAAINLSLSCQCTPTDYDRARLENQVVRAHAQGVSVVAAAGNDAGPVGTPASEPGVFSVGAGNKTGALCAFSNRGTGLALVAPGCGMDLTNPTTGELWSDYEGGTSAATVAASTALSLLRSYRPDLGWLAAEQLLVASAQPTAQAPVLDLKALFRAAGLATLVDAAIMRMPSAQPEQTVQQPEWSDARSTAWSQTTDGGRPDRPKPLRPYTMEPKLLRLVRRGYRITVSVRGRPSGVVLRVLLQRHRSEFGYETVARRAASLDRLTLQLPRPWRGGRLLLRYEHSGRAPTSMTVQRQIGA
jgi:hypothetical protein